MQCVREIRPDLPTFHFQAWLGLLLLVCCGGCGSGYNATIPSPSPPSPTSLGSLATLYTMSNAISGNTVVAYARNADGTLGQAASYATGGWE
jgi:hypothetical protein